MAVWPVVFVQDWPTTRLTKTNVKTDKSYSVVFYEVLFKNKQIGKL